MKRWLALSIVFSALALYAPASASAANSCFDAATGAPLPLEVGPCADVLTQEGRWLTITAGDEEVASTASTRCSRMAR